MKNVIKNDKKTLKITTQDLKKCAQQFSVRGTPNRAENLRSMADWIKNALNRDQAEQLCADPIGLAAKLNRLHGFAEQMGIIAREMDENGSLNVEEIREV